MFRFIGFYSVIFFSLLLSNKLMANKSCQQLLRTSLSHISIGDMRTLNYSVWDIQLSTTQYRVLFNSPGRSTMGTALIDSNLLKHQHREPEIYYILKGSGTTFVESAKGKQRIDLRSGTFFYLPSGMHHYTVAHPDNPLELVYFFPPSENIKYVYDGKLKIDEKEQLISGILNFSDKKQKSRGIKTLIDIENFAALGLKSFTIPEDRESMKIQIKPNTSLFVLKGKGLFEIEANLPPVQLHHGRHITFGTGKEYQIKRKGKEALVILLFES